MQSKASTPKEYLASQRQYVALCHMGLYADPVLLKWFTAEYAKRADGRLDMGKSCMRFRKPDLVPIKLIGELVSKVTPKQWIATYEKNLLPRRDSSK